LVFVIRGPKISWGVQRGFPFGKLAGRLNKNVANNVTTPPLLAPYGGKSLLPISINSEALPFLGGFKCWRGLSFTINGNSRGSYGLKEAYQSPRLRRKQGKNREATGKEQGKAFSVFLATIDLLFH
jgi:hypothetical protein